MSEHQPHSDSYGIGRPAAPDESSAPGLPPLSRYDLLLVTIPLVLVLSGLVGALTSLPVWTAVAVGALAALPLLADGLAVNPPA